MWLCFSLLKGMSFSMPDRMIAIRIATQTSINQRLMEMGFKYVVHDTSTISTDLMNNSAYEGTIAGNISKASILGIVCPMLKSKETVNVLRRFSGKNCQILLEKFLHGLIVAVICQHLENQFQTFTNL